MGLRNVLSRKTLAFILKDDAANSISLKDGYTY